MAESKEPATNERNTFNPSISRSETSQITVRFKLTRGEDELREEWDALFGA